MKILHILNHIKEVGNGIVNVAVDLACVQARSEHQVAIAAGGGSYQTLLKQYGVEYFDLNQSRNLGNLLPTILNYRQIIAEFQPSIVHAHNMTGVVLAKIANFPRQYTLISTVHNEFQKSSHWMGLADRVIAISQAVATSMENRGIPQHKLYIVLNGTKDSPRTLPLSEYTPQTLNRPAIITVAGMYRRKGIDILIKAFAIIAPQFPTANLYLVGEGPDRQLFEQEAKATKYSERIHFTGFCPQPQTYLLASDIFVLASRQEPFGLVITEARTAGCAIVASEVDGIPEALDNGKAGILFPAGDVSALAVNLAKLLSNPQVLQKYQQQALCNLDKFTVERVYEETMAVYTATNKVS